MSNLNFRITDVRKSFRVGEQVIPILRGTSLCGKAGEMVFLVGPSGCGKTTLLSILCGTLKPDSGEIIAFGQELHKLNDRQFTSFRAKFVGFIFQQFNLIPSLTAAENAALPLIIQGVSSREARAKACELLERVGLKEKTTSYPSQLSGGQQQRVAIARALVHAPQLVVCDEPTSALDSHSGHQIMDLLREGAMNMDRTVIVATHDPRTYQYASRVIEMEDGCISRELRTPAEIATLH